MSDVQIITGDCIESMRAMPSDSVHTCVTSPPYFGLRDYGRDGQIGLEPTPDEFVVALVAVFREVRRVLREDGTVWLNLGDSYNNFRSQMSPGQSVHGREKMNGKPGEKSRRRGWSELKEKDLIGIPWRVAFALQADGWYLRQDIIWHKPNPMPESVTDRCTKAHEYIFLLSKSPKYYYDHEAVKEPSSGVSGGGFSKKYAENQPNHGAMRLERPADTGKRNRRSVWTVTTKPFKGAHFATFPPDLIEPCILAGCPEGGTVLDPFGGAGTTGLVAQCHGRNAILCELNPEYAEMARERIEADKPEASTQLGLPLGESA